MRKSEKVEEKREKNMGNLKLQFADVAQSVKHVDDELRTQQRKIGIAAVKGDFHELPPEPPDPPDRYVFTVKEWEFHDPGAQLSFPTTDENDSGVAEWPLEEVKWDEELPPAELLPEKVSPTSLMSSEQEPTIMRLGSDKEEKQSGRDGHTAVTAPEEENDVAAVEDELLARDGDELLSFESNISDSVCEENGASAEWISWELGFWTETMGQAQYLLITPPKLTNTRRMLQEGRGMHQENSGGLEGISRKVHSISDLMGQAQFHVSKSDLFDINRGVSTVITENYKKLIGFGWLQKKVDFTSNPMGQTHNFILTPPIFTNTGTKLQVVDELNNHRDQLSSTYPLFSKPLGVPIIVEGEKWSHNTLSSSMDAKIMGRYGTWTTDFLEGFAHMYGVSYGNNRAATIICFFFKITAENGKSSTYSYGWQLLFKGVGKLIEWSMEVGFRQLINTSILLMLPLVRKWDPGGFKQGEGVLRSATTRACQENQTPQHQLASQLPLIVVQREDFKTSGIEEIFGMLKNLLRRVLPAESGPFVFLKIDSEFVFLDSEATPHSGCKLIHVLMQHPNFNNTFLEGIEIQTMAIFLLHNCPNSTNIYMYKYKGVWICLTILTGTLGGANVNFDVFELYGDKALFDALFAALKMTLSISMTEVLASWKITMAYFAFLVVLFNSHISYISNLDTDTSMYIVDLLDSSLKGLNTSISLQCASVVDNVVVFYFSSITMGEALKLPATANLAFHIAECPNLFPEISKTLLENHSWQVAVLHQLRSWWLIVEKIGHIQWKPGGNHESPITFLALLLCLKLWDPGGRPLSLLFYHLEDKVNFKGGSNDENADNAKDKFGKGKIYVRRGRRVNSTK